MAQRCRRLFIIDDSSGAQIRRAAMARSEQPLQMRASALYAAALLAAAAMSLPRATPLLLRDISCRHAVATCHAAGIFALFA